MTFPFAPRSLRGAVKLSLAALFIGVAGTLTTVLFLLAQDPKSSAHMQKAAPMRPAMSIPANVAGMVGDAASRRQSSALAVQDAARELGQLLSVAAKPGSSSASAAQWERMRSAVEATAVRYLLISPATSADDPGLADARSSFSSAVSALRQRGLPARERSLLERAEQKFEGLHLRGEESLACRREEAAALEALASAAEAAPAVIHALPTPKSQAGRRWQEPWPIGLLLFCAGLSIASALRIAMLATSGTNRPLAHLLEVARSVVHGRIRRKASPRVAGDLRELAEAFNGMLEAQEEAEERLRIANESLELKVSARTAELWRANRALKEESEQRARAQRDFEQAQKMDALGKLAGSIAHDFNNLLTVIIGGAESVQKQIGATHPASSLLQTVQRAGERAAGLTRPLLTFSRNQVLAVESVDLNEAAEEACAMMRRLIGMNIDLRLQFAPGLPPVRTNPNQLQQVLINLGVNARDAMEGMGILTVETRLAKPPEEHPPGGERPWVELVVRDTGCGMDAETKARIFEPFFTTKPVGKGTGLGLATVFGIVKQGGGSLEVVSAPGEGTAFHIVWPAMTPAECAAARPAPELLPPPDLSQGTETVLLVDDDDDIRELATLTLEDHGYRVISASHAEEALLLAEKHGKEIRALITDVVMPGINGVQLAELLSKIVPDLRILFVSGHSNEAISGETLASTRAVYLQKPYRGQALIANVKEVLALAPRPGSLGTGSVVVPFNVESPWEDTDILAAVT